MLVRSWLILLLLALPGLAAARPPHSLHATALTRGSQTGLPLPRFARLKAPVANLRRGPGTRYPIVWVYRRRHLPVMITREFGNWRLLRFSDGTRGWMHRALISGGRAFVVIAKSATLRGARSGHARAVAHLRHGVIGTLVRCAPAAIWCRVRSHGFSGFVRRVDIWGSDADLRRPGPR